MTEIAEQLTPAQMLALAVRTKSPAHLARVFASQAGQFYDRTDFDRLARQTHDLYAEDNLERATLFRARLDRRLYDRYHAGVAWDVRRPTRNADLVCRNA